MKSTKTSKEVIVNPLNATVAKGMAMLKKDVGTEIKIQMYLSARIAKIVTLRKYCWFTTKDQANFLKEKTILFLSCLETNARFDKMLGFLIVATVTI